MLEFIVLGNVPGTHFTLTYSWVLTLSAIFLMMLELRYHKQYAMKVQALTVQSADADVIMTKTTAKPRKLPNKAASQAVTTPKSTAPKKRVNKKQTIKKSSRNISTKQTSLSS